MKKLVDYIENISDDFQSTFTLVNENTLANMMDETETETVENIIKTYMGDNVNVTFTKTNQLGKDESYDIYLVGVIQ